MCFLLDLEWKINLGEKLFSPFTVIKSISILSRSLSSQSTERITFSISFPMMVRVMYVCISEIWGSHSICAFQCQNDDEFSDLERPCASVMRLLVYLFVVVMVGDGSMH